MDRSGVIRRLAELGHEPAADGAGMPLFAPASAEQAAELLGTCTREGWRVRVQGAGSRGGAALAADLAVTTRRLTGFDIYEPDDLTVGIRAGTTHGAAAALLARHKQLLPLDPPGTPAATLGGSFASGEAGPLRAGYGTPRDLALGITLVTADGRLLHLGGQVVKNVAGYDLVRFVVGSRGTLGLITQLHARLRSLPPSDVTVIAQVADGVDAAAAALRLRDAVAPVALELLTPAATGAPWSLALRLHGSAAVTAAAQTTVTRMHPAARTLDGLAAAGFWADLAAVEAAAPIHIRCTGLPSAVPDLLAAAASLLNSRSDNDLPAWRGAVHATGGNLRLWPARASHEPNGALAAALHQLGSRVASVNGTCTCDRGPEAVRALLPGAPAAPRVLELERELRLRFDPGAILVGA